MSPRLSTTTVTASWGRCASSSKTTSMSQVWNACSLRRRHGGKFVEPEAEGPHGEAQAGAIGGAHRLEDLEHALVGDQRVVGLGPGRLGIPLVPHRRCEVLRRLGAGQRVVQAPAQDGPARTKVRQHVGDRPLPGVGLRLELGVVEAAAELVEPADRVA